MLGGETGEGAGGGVQESVVTEPEFSQGCDDDDPRSDAALVDAANAGDVRAFEALYRRYYGWVARLAQRFTGDHAGAMDVTQEAFIYLLRKFPGLTLRARLTTLLYPTVKHLSRDWRARRAKQAPAADPPPTLAAPEQRDQLADRDELDAALAGLSQEHREVLLMRYVDGMSVAEIAAALDVPVGTVKSRLHHAAASVRRKAGAAERIREKD